MDNKYSQYLIESGWKEYPDGFRKTCRNFYKFFDTPTKCHLNDDYRGIQITAHVSNWEGKESLELELHGELLDGSWVKLALYALNDQDINTVLVPRLLSMWEDVNKPREEQ